MPSGIFKLGLLAFISCFVLIYTQAFDPNAVPHTTKSHLLSSIKEGTDHCLVYFYTNFEECPKCKENMPLFQEAAGYLSELEDEKIKSYKLAVKLPEYGVTTFPQLIFFDGKVPFRYDNPDQYEPDDIVDWIEEAKETPVPELNDQTFEHLTQASTGATTGDWLILFANSERPDCMKPRLADISTVAARLRRRKNVATICTASNPKTAKRFGFSPEKHCSQILFFHRTELYHYDDEEVQPKKMLNFVLDGYKLAEAKPVPKPYDETSAELKNNVAELTAMLYEHVRSSTILFICATAAGVFIVFLSFSLILRKIRSKKLA